MVSARRNRLAEAFAESVDVVIYRRMSDCGSPWQCPMLQDSGLPQISGELFRFARLIGSCDVSEAPNLVRTTLTRGDAAPHLWFDRT
jgi:hypothetical protein